MNQTTLLQPVFYNMDKWIQANKGAFKPPVCNKIMHNSQLIVFFVGGPNNRSDYHIEAGEELFYMVKGNMCLKVLSQGAFQDIHIKEGEIFLLPSRIPHSPQRSKETIGLVIERERKPSEYDCLRWYVKNTKETLYEHWIHVLDIGAQVDGIIKDFHASEQYQTGRPIAGTVTKDPPLKIDEGRKMEKPFSLKTWIEENKHEINENGYKRLFDDSYQSKISVHGPSDYQGCTSLHETFVWQMEGSRTIYIQGKPYQLNANDTLLIPSDTQYQSRGSSDCYSIFITMNPHENLKF